MAAIAQLTALGGDAIRRAVAWWLAELRGLLPWQLAGRAERAPAILDVSPRGAVLALAKRGSSPAAELPLSGFDPQDASERVHSVMRARQLGDDIVIRLDESVLLRSSVTLPLAAENALRPILQNQLERLVPLPPAEVSFEYRVTSRSPATKTLKVELVTARRAMIDNAVALARSIGLVPRLVFAGSGSAGRDGVLVLWQASRDGNEPASLRRLKHGLVVASALMLVAAYVIYVYRLDERGEDLQAEVAKVAKQAAIARTLVEQQTATQSALVLLDRRRKEPPPLALLNELTVLLPSNTWVSQLTLQKRNIEIIGYSRRVSDFVPRINNSDSFWNVKFRSPIALSPDGKGERFDVSFDVYVEETP
jgi:general secretion pathway protein L